MTTVMKVSIASKVDKDMVVTSTFEHIVSNEDDAKELGKLDARLFKSYADGYGEALDK